MKPVISIIGLGNVGQTIVQSLLMIKDHMFIINIMDPGNVSGSVYDLQHAAAVYKYHDIVYNDPELLNQSDFIFHTAGPSFELGATRLSITDESIKMTYTIFKDFVPKKKPYVIVISNPVDIISYHTWKATGLPSNQVFGTGTFLDTVRFEHLLATAFKLNTSYIKGLILGEHGDSQVPVKSRTTVGNIHPHKASNQQKIDHAAIATVKAAYEICLTQGATKYGVSLCAIRMMLSILDDSVLEAPASILINKKHQQILKCNPIYLSLPCQLSKKGISQKNIDDLTLAEISLLQKSAEVIEKHT